MVTKTLLFAGERGPLDTVDGQTVSWFRSYDKATGAIVSEMQIPANVTNVPMTYMSGGKQYIVVAVAAVGKPAELLALALAVAHVQSIGREHESASLSGLFRNSASHASQRHIIPPHSHRRLPMARRFLALAGLLVVAVVSLAAQYGTTNGEWRSYAGEPGSTKYSPLDQINKDNVKNLRIAWRFKTDNYGVRPDYNMQVTPLMVNGVMYAQAGVRRAVVAHRSRNGRAVVDVAHGRRQARRRCAAPGIGPRRRVLDRRQRRRAHSHRHARLSASSR